MYLILSFKGRKIYYKNLFDFGNREEQEITEERLYVICIILYNFSVLNQNAIFMTGIECDASINFIYERKNYLLL
jgi:hypothetical protein